MPQYGDEKFIYAIAQMEGQNHGDKTPNDIKNGYIVIDGNYIPFSERAIIEDKFYMTIPSDFTPMPQELTEIKYPNENGPDIIFMSEDGSININFKLIDEKIKKEDVAALTDLLQQGIVEGNPACKIISSSIIEGEMQIGYFDFVSSGSDFNTYNLMFLFPLDDQMVLGSFNCEHFNMARWLEVARQMVRSVRVIQ
jgi:hypothetical protein